jgi:hypothetical protein
MNMRKIERKKERTGGRETESRTSRSKKEERKRIHN